MSHRDTYSERSRSRTRQEHSQVLHQKAQRFAPDNLLKFLKSCDEHSAWQGTSNSKSSAQRDKQQSQKHASLQKPSSTKHDHAMRNKNFQSFQKHAQSKKKLLPPSTTNAQRTGQL